MIDNKVFTALLLLAAGLTCMNTVANKTAPDQTTAMLMVDCAFDRSRLLTISHELLVKWQRLHDEKKDLKELSRNLLNNNLQLGEDHAGLMRQILALVDSFQKVVGDYEVSRRERALLQYTYRAAVQEKRTMEKHYESAIRTTEKIVEKWLKAKDGELAKAVKDKNKALLRIKNLQEGHEMAQEEKKEVMLRLKQLSDDNDHTRKQLKTYEEYYVKALQENEIIKNKCRQVIKDRNRLWEAFEQKAKEDSIEQKKMLHEHEKYIKVVEEKDQLSLRVKSMKNAVITILEQKKRNQEAYEQALREADDNLNRTVEKIDKQYNEAVGHKDESERALKNLSMKYNEMLRDKTEVIDEFRDHIANIDKEFTEIIMTKDYEILRFTEENEKVNRNFEVLKEQYEKEVREKQKVREYHEQAVYVATLTIDRMKKEIKEKDLKIAQEKEAADKAREQFRSVGAFASPESDGVNEILLEKNLRLGKKKHKCKKKQEQCEKMMNETALALKNKAKIKEKYQRLQEEKERQVVIIEGEEFVLDSGVMDNIDTKSEVYDWRTD